MDQNFLIHNAWMIRQLSQGTNLILGHSFLGILLKAAPEILHNKNILIAENIFHLYTEHKRTLNSLNPSKATISAKSAFSFDPEYGFAMAERVYMGGSTSILHKTYSHLYFEIRLRKFYKPHFYAQDTKNGIIYGVDNDYETKILPFFKSALKVFKEHEIMIFNYSQKLDFHTKLLHLAITF